MTHSIPQSPSSLPDVFVLPSDQDASGRTLGDAELEALTEVIRSGTLISTKGEFVSRLEKEVASLLGVKYAYACSSGTAAIHVALAALNLEPGDEVITTPITDMGALAPILYQGAIPVFADVDPDSLNVTEETVAKRLTERTRAIIATHLFGNPCDIQGIKKLAAMRELFVIEDCAQAFMARSQGQLAGTFGEIGTFSLQQGKHITTGEGGLVVTNNDEVARRLFLAINKAWGYGDPNPDHYFLALNYRLSELQGAVGLAQLAKLGWVVDRRVASARRLSEAISDLAGLRSPVWKAGDTHSFWKYIILVDESVIPGGAVALARQLKEMDVTSAPRYIQKPAYKCAVFVEQRTFGSSRWPFTLAHPDALDYRDELYPGVVAGLNRVLVLPWTERYEDAHVDFIARALHRGVDNLVDGRRGG
ncbi:MAG TPA: DegT/DnrJ/EryC1/StrS family aminotransferase [Acidimicrobiia bacterium]|nr:DegT/DnrJ/EryC1/StrS family aminotransferase [Acidimicrobiia bacterium]